MAPLGIGLATFIVAGALSEWAARVKPFSSAGSAALRRMRGLPRSVHATALAHAGVGLCLLGIVASSAWQRERVLAMHIGDHAEIAGYELVLRGVSPRRGPNYEEQVGLLEVTRGGAPVSELAPSKRLYDAPRQPTTETAIHASWRGDLYAALGDARKDGGYVVRLYFNPLVRLIWIGAMVMAVGGALSLSDRRLRVGAPRRARRPTPYPAE
jgi:cytochrome c-type biogenesis protein CcmF